MAIVRVADTATEKLFKRQRVKGFGPDVRKTGLKKLLILHAATSLTDLRIPPGNKLEALTGDRAGQHSIRINDQYRLCFRWDGNNAHDVEIVDYH